jgi:hypothetical protein
MTNNKTRGRLDDQTIRRVEAAVAAFLGIGVPAK